MNNIVVLFLHCKSIWNVFKDYIFRYKNTHIYFEVIYNNNIKIVHFDKRLFFCILIYHKFTTEQEILLYVFFRQRRCVKIGFDAISNSFSRPSLHHSNRKTAAINSVEILIVVVLVDDNKRSSFRTWLAGVVTMYVHGVRTGKPMDRYNEFQSSFRTEVSVVKKWKDRRKKLIKWHEEYITYIGCSI